LFERSIRISIESFFCKKKKKKRKRKTYIPTSSSVGPPRSERDWTLRLEFHLKNGELLLTGEIQPLGGDAKESVINLLLRIFGPGTYVPPFGVGGSFVCHVSMIYIDMAASAKLSAFKRAWPLLFQYATSATICAE
jgi:hypothetical protein